VKLSKAHSHIIETLHLISEEFLESMLNEKHVTIEADHVLVIDSQLSYPLHNIKMNGCKPTPFERTAGRTYGDGEICAEVRVCATVK